MIRLEVQYKYPKLYPLAKEVRKNSKFHVSLDDISIEALYQAFAYDEVHSPSIPIDVTLSGKVSDIVNRKHFAKIIGRGDYFTLNNAKSIVKSYGYRRDKEDRLIFTLSKINDCHGVAKAKAKLHGPDVSDFNRSLKDLDSILVNPVTIPRRWNIRHIPNLLRAYDDSIYVEELIPEQEYIARQHIVELLSKNDG